MNKSTWIVLGLVLVLGAIYFLTKKDEVSAGIKHLQLPAFVQENVDAIEIQGKETVRMRKKGGEWKLVVGTDDREKLVAVNQAYIDSFFQAAQGIKDSYYVTNLPEKYADLEVQGEQAIHVKLMSGDAIIWALSLGKNASSGRYAKIPDRDAVHVVNGSFWQLTRNGPNDWRERSILPVAEGTLSSFTLERSHGDGVSLEKSAEDKSWKLSSSQKGVSREFRVDPIALTKLVQSAASLQAQGFVDEQRELTDPILTIRAGGENEEYKIDIYPDTDKKYVVKTGSTDQLFQISEHSFQKLYKTLADLRDLSLFQFDKSSVVGVKLRHNNQTIALSKKEGVWNIDQPKQLPKEFEFDPSTVDDMLSLLSGIRGQRIAQAGKDVPVNANWDKNWLVELRDDKNESIRFYVGKNKAKKDEFVAKGNIDNNLYIIPSSRIATLNSGIDAFKKETFELPEVDPNMKGFESLPEDVKRKLLEAASKQRRR